MANMFVDIIQTLEQWSGEQKLIEKAIDGCKVFMQNAALDDAEHFPEGNTGVDILRGRKLSDIQLHFEHQALVFKNANLSYPYFDIQIGLYVTDPTGLYYRDLEPIGTYRLIVGMEKS